MKKSFLVLLPCITCFNCHKLPSRQFCMSEQCSNGFLNELKQDCSGQIKTWLDDNSDLLCLLKIGQVVNIVDPCKQDKDTKLLQERYRTILAKPNEKFDRRSLLISRIDEIASLFDKEERNPDNKIRKDREIEKQLREKIGIYENQKHWSEDYSDDVRNLKDEIKNKIDTVDFIFSPEKDNLYKQMNDIIDDYRQFCSLTKEEDYVQQQKNLHDKIKNFTNNISDSFIYVWEKKTKNEIDNDLKDFFQNSDKKTLDNIMHLIKDKDSFTKEDIRQIISTINVANLCKGKNNTKFPELLGFKIEWINKTGARIKSKFDSIYIPSTDCETKTWNGYDLVFSHKNEDNNFITRLFNYIEQKFIISRGKIEKLNDDSETNIIPPTKDVEKFVKLCYFAALEKEK